MIEAQAYITNDVTEEPQAYVTHYATEVPEEILIWNYPVNILALRVDSATVGDYECHLGGRGIVSKLQKLLCYSAALESPRVPASVLSVPSWWDSVRP
jgi:hypothetical protein